MIEDNNKDKWQKEALIEIYQMAKEIISKGPPS
jgi:hypothetical protein